ncbi:HAD-IC family P-type ATPase [Marivirga sp. S37H4]|uniref:HAD-IC family P-type ATPase n=1 Tax=Marivirga aurantiaca TaxID=2802615 RepID=A0A935C8L8_9BACT|nr:cation-transporting P-type ATPase [Marivirga aurantiaca]MBK6265570.1 HAD-IC family P-type ATPase [Marivirga aurantiaca]
MAEKKESKRLIEDVYLKSGEEVIEKVSANPDKGLTDDEVKKRKEKFGRNILEEQKKRGVWQILLDQVTNPVIYLLTAAAILAFVYGDIPEGIAIVVVLLINTLIGFWMEYKAQKSMDALKQMDKIQARVLRNGEKKKINAEEIVPGDILLVESGDLVAADARVIEATELGVDESPLTGESVPVTKQTEPLEEKKGVADRTNIIFKGTAVTGGSAKAVVYATGMQTELGDISAMVGEEEKDEVPLNQKLNKLTKNLIIVTIALAAAFFLFGWLAGKEIYPLIQTSIAWTIAAIPEGLPIVASIALARGMLRLSKQHVIVKKLEAVETLGETTVIFTDKTGTLTKNQLTVNTFSFPDGVRMDVDWHSGAKPAIKEHDDPYGNQNFSHILKISALANDATLNSGKEIEEGVNTKKQADSDKTSQEQTEDKSRQKETEGNEEGNSEIDVSLDVERDKVDVDAKTESDDKANLDVDVSADENRVKIHVSTKNTEKENQEENKKKASKDDDIEEEEEEEEQKEENDDGNEEESEKGEGDPLDIALLNFSKKFDADLYKKNRSLERKLHDPFDSDNMVMGAIHQDNGGYYVAGKGAAHAILDRSSKILSNGEVADLSEEDKKYWHNKNDQLADEGLRVLAFAYKNTDTLPQGEEAEDFLHDLTFTGLIGFIDPPRKEVGDAIKICSDAGIKVVMVTGDHPGTAKNVAKEIGIYADGEEKDALVISGKDLQKELENEDDSKLVNTHVFSRVDPAQKLSLIKHFQEAGELVGMTGDGVNDSPALKRANIGIAMGKRGTQIAQEVSDMVLKDDAFGSIVNAIEQGRIIFGNIRKFIIYQLSYHLSEIIIIAAISFSLFTLALLPLQLLFLNLLSDVFPALALGVGKGNPEVMKEKPKDPEEPILNKNNWIQIVIYGIIIAICICGAYLYAHFVWQESEGVTNNIAFFSLALAQLLHVFNMREGSEQIFKNQVTNNKFIWMALAFCLVALIAAYFIPPVAEVLSFQNLELRAWLLILITSILPLIIIQSLKFFKKNL